MSKKLNKSKNFILKKINKYKINKKIRLESKLLIKFSNKI